MPPAKNPWSDLKRKASNIIPPVAVLREQAQLLTESTEGVVQGIVETVSDEFDADDDRVKHYLSAVVPAMDNYTIRLAWIIHDVFLYPANVDSVYLEGKGLPSENKEQLEENLNRIPSLDKVQRIVTSLFA